MGSGDENVCCAHRASLHPGVPKNEMLKGVTLQWTRHPIRGKGELITRNRRESKDKHRPHGSLGIRLWGEYSLSKRPTVVIASSEECQEVITDCQIVDSSVALQGRTVRVQANCHKKDILLP